MKEPLKLAFNEKYQEYTSTLDAGVGYSLLELAFTLDSKRIQEQGQLQQLVLETPGILKDPVLNILATISMDILGKEKYHELLTELKKTKPTLSEVQKNLIKLPMKKLRFSAIDNINQDSKVTLLTEGPTDATILEYAFMVLTGGCIPYWNITAAGPLSSKNSCEEVAKTLTQTLAHSKVDPLMITIGIFDHDSAGLGAYRGRLEERFFDELEKDSIKKHKEASIYGLCLPVPGEMDKYLRADQVFNFFEIEHYFGESFLKGHDMLEETELQGIYKIKDTTGKKTKFASEIKEITDPKAFEHFLLIFRKIDELSGVTIDYLI